MKRTIFIIGTDTGVGKTAVTGLLTAHLQRSGANFRALKPFCSGDRSDALLLQELQPGISLETVNPYYFSEPLTPWTAARRAGKQVTLAQALAFLRAQEANCERLLVEGAGGLRSPLGDRFDAGDLIEALHAEVLLVASNRLGVLNHVLLTLEALRARGVTGTRIVLNDAVAPSLAAESNFDDLHSLAEVPLVRLPFLEDYRPVAGFLKPLVDEHRAALEAMIA